MANNCRRRVIGVDNLPSCLSIESRGPKHRRTDCRYGPLRRVPSHRCYPGGRVLERHIRLTISGLALAASWLYSIVVTRSPAKPHARLAARCCATTTACTTADAAAVAGVSFETPDATYFPPLTRPVAERTCDFGNWLRGGVQYWTKAQANLRLRQHAVEVAAG
jgi:hypothetical protein